MIDHLLGRPSVKSRRLQVLAVLAFWSAYLFKGHKHGPPLIRFLSKLLTKRLSAFQTVTITMIYLYAARNFSTLVGLASPEPMANMYDAAYFRATWVLTALDAGFWTAMKIQYKPLRDLASIVFSLFYMVAAEQADEKVRKVRGNITVEHLRVSWNKGNQSPYLRFLQGLVRPRFTRWPPRAIRIPRPSTSDYKEPVSGWLYYDGPLSELEHHNKVVLDIPGGGFVAMDPRCNDDKLNAWAAKTGLPILSLDYKKAPEYPYPYALNECFDVYCTLIRSKGRCIGLSGREAPRVVVTGDSAGGTLATALTLMVVESLGRKDKLGAGESELPVPDGLVVFYPALDMNIGSWMSDEQMALINDRRMRSTNKRIMQRKTNQYNDLVGTPAQSDDEDDNTSPLTGPAVKIEKQETNDSDSPRPNNRKVNNPAPEYAHSGPSTWSKSSTGSSKSTPPRSTATSTSTSHHPAPMRTRLAMSSMISYFNDRVLTPEMMRAMIILYVGPHNRPDFSRDYLLSPILAPDSLLAKFPKTYFLTGERDPLVDDTVIFAGRLRRVKAAQLASNGKRFEYRESDATTAGFDEREVAEVALIPGISHGFLQFPAVYPPAWGLIERVTLWFEDCFVIGEEKERQRQARRRRSEAVNGAGNGKGGRGRAGTVVSNGGGRSLDGNGTDGKGKEKEKRVRHESTSGDEDRPLEMMRMTRKSPAKSTDITTQQQQQLLKEDSAENGDVEDEEDTNVPDNDEDEDDEEDEDVYLNPSLNGNGHGSESTSGSSTEREQRTRTNGNGTGTGKGKLRNGRRSVKKTRGGKSLSLVKLASSDDLLGRRMHGLAGGLTGLPPDAE
ncbi:hormone-sensitive lipase [Naviculisporaceae sp. PSN 640]